MIFFSPCYFVFSSTITQASALEELLSEKDSALGALRVKSSQLESQVKSLQGELESDKNASSLLVSDLDVVPTDCEAVKN